MGLARPTRSSHSSFPVRCVGGLGGVRSWASGRWDGRWGQEGLDDTQEPRTTGNERTDCVDTSYIIIRNRSLVCM